MLRPGDYETPLAGTDRRIPLQLILGVDRILLFAVLVTEKDSFRIAD
jgi:hypothetical protein